MQRHFRGFRVGHSACGEDCVRNYLFRPFIGWTAGGAVEVS